VVERMRPYLAVLSARYRLLLQYRAAALAGFATAAFFSLAAADQSPMTLTQVVIYVWLGQALLGLLPWNVDPELSEKMLSGAVAYELLRPLDLYNFWYARTVAYRTATATLRAIPMVVVVGVGLPLVGMAEWALPPPPSVAAGFLFLGSIAATVLLASAITMLMHVALVWTLTGRGFNAIMMGVVSVLSGLIIPLPLFPDWLQGILYWQPFRGLADVPFRIYGGHIGVDAALLEIVLQLVWTVVIVGFGRAALAYASRRVVVQGG